MQLTRNPIYFIIFISDEIHFHQIIRKFLPRYLYVISSLRSVLIDHCFTRPRCIVSVVNQSGCGKSENDGQPLLSFSTLHYMSRYNFDRESIQPDADVKFIVMFFIP